MRLNLFLFHRIFRPIISQKLKFNLFLHPNSQRRLLSTLELTQNSCPFAISKFSTLSGREAMGSSSKHGKRAGADSENVVNGALKIKGKAGKRKRENGGDKDSNYRNKRREGGRNSSEISSGIRKKNESGSKGSLFSGKGKGRGSSEFMKGGKRKSNNEDIVIEEVEEKNDKGFMSFKDLIDDEESDDGNEEEVELEIGDEELLKNGSALPAPQISPDEAASYLSESRFDQCPVSALSLKGIKDAGYVNMTMVQEATLPLILKGKDVLAKAKTGTGKTVAFLLPAIELVVKSPPITRDQKRPPILVLVVCPTRELASQAAAEANKLLKYHPSIGVQVVIGGTRLGLEQKRMQTNPCQILVATPGRLRDHVDNTAGFASRMMGVKILVLDEADQLLDMGFLKEIQKIIAAVPKERQTLLFSATVPPEVRQICHVAMKRDHEFVNTVVEGSVDTHSQVTQTYLVAPLDKQFSILYTIIKQHIADDVNYKVIVFCTTAMVTKLVAELLAELKLKVREIHSRKPQSYRTRISDEFRRSKALILVTSDVSARGVDYPDVTLVIQIGVPSDKQQYIHRLGRTGRKGKEGLGILMLAPWEEYFLQNIREIPISKAPEPLVDTESRKKVERALSIVDKKTKESAYQAWLGYYNSNKKIGKDKYKLVELVNEFSRSMGLDNPPALTKQVLGKMGLKTIPGLRSK